MKNQFGRNALHLAALYASTETMELLTAAGFSGPKPDAQDKNGNSPNECFLECRNAHCAIARKSFGEEKEAWIRLMASAHGQRKASLETADDSEGFDDEGIGLMQYDSLTSEELLRDDRDEDSCKESDGDSSSEEVYIDAEG